MARNHGKRTAARADKVDKVDKAGKAGKTAAQPRIDLDMIRELARIAGEFNLSEVDADPSGRIRVRREMAAPSEERMSSLSPLSIALAPPPPEGAAQPGSFVTSPFVGTFYHSPSPDTPPFVEVGDAVRKGQVVCIVEAMKLMNEIEAETEGTIAEVLVKNGAHVEYGQHLFRLGKS